MYVPHDIKGRGQGEIRPEPATEQETGRVQVSLDLANLLTGEVNYAILRIDIIEVIEGRVDNLLRDANNLVVMTMCSGTGDLEAKLGVWVDDHDVAMEGVGVRAKMGGIQYDAFAADAAKQERGKKKIAEKS
jgi:hypothetical protein